MHVQEWLETVPAAAVYALVGVVIGLESLGIPLPGEIILVSSALLASQHGDIDPVVLGACATAGAIIGDSIGYAEPAEEAAAGLAELEPGSCNRPGRLSPHASRTVPTRASPAPAACTARSRSRSTPRAATAVTTG
ncbi:hypothetical protein SVIOM74S_01262 [Streptomyces violarus]